MTHVQQVTTWRVSLFAAHKHISNHLVHGFSEMNSIPIYVLAWFRAGTNRRGAASGEYIEVVGITGATAGLEALLEAVLARILHDTVIGIPVVSIGDYCMRKLFPEILQLGLEDKVVTVALVVHTLHTSYAVSIVFRS